MFFFRFNQWTANINNNSNNSDDDDDDLASSLVKFTYSLRRLLVVANRQELVPCCLRGTKSAAGCVSLKLDVV